MFKAQFFLNEADLEFEKFIRLIVCLQGDMFRWFARDGNRFSQRTRDSRGTVSNLHVIKMGC